jgi:phage major head subunit gpT-like protein
MSMTRQQFWQLLAPGARKNFVEWQDFRYHERQYEKFLNTESSDKAYEDSIHFAGLPPMPTKTENAPVGYFNLIQGGSKRYVMQTYAMACRVSWELSEDDLYGVIAQAPKAIVKSGMFTKEQTCANVLNLGFSSTGTITDDGVSIYNNQHPLLGGVSATNILPGASNVISAAGTYPNTPAVAADLSFTSLQLMKQQFERMPDSQGLPIVARPKLLIIPPELEQIAIELLGSGGKPYTGDNEVNALQVLGLQYTVNNYLTSPSAWFVNANKDEHRMRCFERAKMEDDMDDDFDTRATKFLAITRFAVGADSWFGTWASNGA